MCLRSWILIEVKWELISGKYNTKLLTIQSFSLMWKNAIEASRKTSELEVTRRRERARQQHSIILEVILLSLLLLWIFIHHVWWLYGILNSPRRLKERRHHQQLGKSLKKPLLINARNCIYPPLHVIMNQWLERQTSCWSGKLTLDICWRDRYPLRLPGLRALLLLQQFAWPA